MKEKFAIVFSMVLWGSLGLFVKNIKLPAIEIAFVRALVATITFILLKFFLSLRIFDFFVFFLRFLLFLIIFYY